MPLVSQGFMASIGPREHLLPYGMCRRQIVLPGHRGFTVLYFRLTFFNLRSADIFSLFQNKLPQRTVSSLVNASRNQLISINDIHIHMDRIGFILIDQTGRYIGMASFSPIHKPVAALDHSLVHEPFEGFIKTDPAAVKQKFRPHSAVQQVATACSVPPHTHPPGPSVAHFPVTEFRVIGRIHIPEGNTRKNLHNPGIVDVSLWPPPNQANWPVGLAFRSGSRHFFPRKGNAGKVRIIQRLCDTVIPTDRNGSPQYRWRLNPASRIR